MTKYRIVPKRDWGPGPGHWLPNSGTHGTGKYGFVRTGFVVTYQGANVAPGAGWFRTIPAAMAFIESILTRDVRVAYCAGEITREAMDCLLGGQS